MSVIAVVLLVLLVAAPAFIHFTKAGGGPGAKHVAVAVSLIAAMGVGYLTQRTRFCMIAGIRDFILFKEKMCIRDRQQAASSISAHIAGVAKTAKEPLFIVAAILASVTVTLAVPVSPVCKFVMLKTLFQ